MFLLFASVAGIASTKIGELRTALIDKLRQAWKADVTFSVDDVLNILSQQSNHSLRSSLEMADRMAPLLAYSAQVHGNSLIWPVASVLSFETMHSISYRLRSR
jgi:hypothetical protein